uniref:Uncharacterized protein n=1 Tax=Arundo donax TaxID=35708 RepID=A0A0A9E335_ARUDO
MSVSVHLIYQNNETVTTASNARLKDCTMFLMTCTKTMRQCISLIHEP